MINFYFGSGLCPVEVSTGHVRLWTRVRIRMCPVEILTGHKLCPFIFIPYMSALYIYVCVYERERDLFAFDKAYMFNVSYSDIL